MDKMADAEQQTKDLQVCVRSLQEKMDVINQVEHCLLHVSMQCMQSVILFY